MALGAAKKTAEGAAFLVRDARVGMDSQNRGINLLGYGAERALAAGNKLLKYTPERYVTKPSGKVVRQGGGLKFTKLGMGVLVGAGALAGARDASEAHIEKQTGQIDANKRTATPEINLEEYAPQIKNGGATGDLVFALHQNRRG